MKTLTKYISLAALALSLTGCEDEFLEEQTYGLILPDNFFTTHDDLEKAVNGCYDYINIMYNQTGTMAVCMGGDDVTTLAGGNKEGYKQFDVFSAQDNNDRMGAMWDGAYSSIKQANIILEQTPNIVEFGGSVNTQEELDQQKIFAEGQAYFIRAMAYYNLVRIWGEVPLVLDLDFNYDITKSSQREIYDQIISDLKMAETMLPATKDDYVSDIESATAHARPVQGTAKAFLASVYLQSAGYPVKDQAAYALAAAKAKEVMDNEATYGYALMDNYGDLWLQDNNVNDEIVFGCHFNHLAPTWHWSSGNMTAPLAYMPGDVGGWDDLFAELTFFENFPEGPRKDATFITETRVTVESTTGEDSVVVTPWEDFAQAHPYYKKWVHVDGYDENQMDIFIDWWSSRTMMVMRYAEVLLVYAEAQAMSAGADDAAYAAVNRVRARAGLADLTPGLSAEAFQDSVVAERGWEFAGNEPNARWFDLVRLEMVEAVTENRHENEIPIVNQPTKDRYFAPIPQRDAMLNPNLAK